MQKCIQKSGFMISLILTVVVYIGAIAFAANATRYFSPRRES
jgi:hypothetical protein